jgi:hypothetical protein
MTRGSQQLALALFQDLEPRGESVVSASTDLGYKRSNAFGQIVDLSLAARRLLDVAYFFVADDPELRNEYRVDFNLFRWLMGTTSKNRSHLTRIIREAQQAAIVVDTGDHKGPWASTPLMGEAIVKNSEFSFELSARLQRAIKNPTSFHFLSLRYIFKSIHSKVLYDRLQPFMTDGVTPWFEVGELRAWMGCETKTYDLFKHFRNKVLEVAMAEINDVAGIQVQMLTANVPGSKRIGQLRFRMQGRQPEDDPQAALTVLRSMYETLRKDFALNQDEFNEIITNRAQYTDERITQAMDYTRHHVSTGRVNIRAGGYFMKALREGYLLGELDKQIHQQSLALETVKREVVRNSETRVVEANAAATAKDQKTIDFGWTHYEQLPPEDQAAMVDEFGRSQAGMLLAKVMKIQPGELRSHLKDPRLRSTFGSFAASKAPKPAQPARARKTLSVA